MLEVDDLSLHDYIGGGEDAEFEVAVTESESASPEILIDPAPDFFDEESFDLREDELEEAFIVARVFDFFEVEDIYQTGFLVGLYLEFFTFYSAVMKFQDICDLTFYQVIPESDIFSLFVLILIGIGSFFIEETHQEFLVSKVADNSFR